MAWRAASLPRTAILALALPLALLAGSRGAADDWPSWLGPSHDGTSRETGWRKDWPPEGPPRLFEKRIGEGYSAVGVAAGRLVLLHRLGDEIVVEALDPLSGEGTWRFAYPTDYVDRYGYNGGPRCAPIIDPPGKRVFVLGPQGTLHALDLEAGRLLWKRDLQAEFKIQENFFGVGAAPVLDADRIHLHLGGTDTGTGLAFALEAATGRVAWKTPTDGGSYASPRVAEAGGARHVLVFHRGGLSSLDPADGRERWKFPWRARVHESVNAATPLVAGDLVFCSASYRTGSLVLRLRGDEKEVVWKDEPDSREKAMEAHWATPLLIDGHLYGFSGRHESETDLRCVELATGKVLWRWKSDLGRGSLIASGGHVIALGERGDLALLKLGPGGHEQLRSVRRILDPPSWTPPVLAGGVLYLRDERRLVALDLRP